MRQAKRHQQIATPFFVAVLAVALAATVRADPPAEEILQKVRFQQTSQEQNLKGALRTGSKSEELKLVLKGDLMRYEFPESGIGFQIRLGEKKGRFEKVTRGSVAAIRAEDRDDPLFATGITVGDLAMDFLYWSDATVIDEDKVKGRAAWKLQLRPPKGSSAPGPVILTVDKQSGALMRIEGMDAQGRRWKRFEVVEIQPYGESWFLKNMRIEVFDPATGKVSVRSYLEIEDLNRN